MQTHSTAITPRLKVLYVIMLFMITLMYADAAYLALVSFLEFWTLTVWQTSFYQSVFLYHVFGGLLLSGVMAVFIGWHGWRSYRIPNPTARRLGFIMSVVVLVITLTGILLIRVVGWAELNHPLSRQMVYWLHVIAPIIAPWLFWLHRLAGRPIQWKVGRGQLAFAILFLLGFGWMHYRESPGSVSRDKIGQTPINERLGGDQFSPALTRTESGQHVSSSRLMNDEFCKECHRDVHSRWADSVHHFSSFNNPAYSASVAETKEILLKRVGNADALQWCAGCHDPVPLLSGRLLQADFNVNQDPTAKAGITCTVCHGIVNISSTRGNADYVFAEPTQYPFQESENSVLRWVNRQMIKAKPALHKKTYLKPLHKSAEFCASCHKVHLPKELNDYKDFLRGQNHYDSFLLSGVSGHGSRSFYYPETAHENCNRCHMPVQASDDIAARPLGPNGVMGVHDHLFPGANTAIPWLNGDEQTVAEQQKFLRDCLRVDLFGLRDDGKIDGKLTAPLDLVRPELQSGRSYLLDVVVRTLKVGHHFTQGTIDSNQVWVRIRVSSQGQLIQQSGEIDENGVVDPDAHFINAYVIDREGNKISRRNTQDIFVKVYDHQIPPGAGQTIHYQLDVPEQIEGSLEISADVLYRKFDSEYMQFVAEHARELGSPLRNDTLTDEYHNSLPVSILAEDRITLTLTNEQPAEVSEFSTESLQKFEDKQIPEWQRWNDYGIGLFLKGKAELRQAEDAFLRVEELGYAAGSVNLARCYFREGRLDETALALKRASENQQQPTAPWTINYYVGLVNEQQGNLVAAERAFRSVLESVTPETRRRGFDFSRDYLVRNQLATTLFNQARQIRVADQAEDKNLLLESAAMHFETVLEDDSENLTALYNLAQIYQLLGNEESSGKYQKLSERYQPDYNARDQAVRKAREKSPHANAGAEPITIYKLKQSSYTSD